MKDGEGTKENLTCLVSFPYAQLGNEFSCQSQKSEDGDDLTEYSSCDGESEYERYCSANSAMSTPTVSGSVATVFHEFPRSFKLGDGSYKARNFRGWKKLSDHSGLGPSIRGSEYGDGKGDKQEEGLVGIGKGLDLYGSAEYAYMDEETSSRNMDMGDEWYVKDEMRNMRSNNGTKFSFNGSSYTSKEYKNTGCIEGDTEASGVGNSLLEIKQVVTEEDTEFVRGTESVDWSLGVSNLQRGTGNGGAGYSAESETSARYEYSEGEDSMFGGNSDDEKKLESSSRREVKFLHEQRDKNENGLVMGSAIAFGSEDWDDFLQENGEATLTIMVHDKLRTENPPSVESENGCSNSASIVNAEFPSASLTTSKEKEEGILLPSYHDQGGNGSTEHATNNFVDPLSHLNQGKGEHIEEEKALLIKNNQTKEVNKSAKSHAKSSVHNLLESVQNLQIQRGEASLVKRAKLKAEVSGQTHQSAYTEGVIHIHDHLVSRIPEPHDLKLLSEPISHSATSKDYPSVEQSDDRTVEILADSSSFPSSASAANDATRSKQRSINSPSSVTYLEDHLTTSKTDNLELNEFYSEVVHDMEEILLDSGESPGFALGNKIYDSYITVPSRDGGSTASTSTSSDNADTQHPVRYDGVEVIGARQKTGDVSLSERLVGVKKYTVYRIKVWSGEDYWEIERRFRDFCALYYQLKKSFSNKGWILPPVWSAIERESRNIFGSASPDVIADRSVLIQECVLSLLNAKFPPGPLNALFRFLSPSKDFSYSPASATNIPQSPFASSSTSRRDISSLGKKISLLVHKRPLKPKKQLLDQQHYSCAGCYTSFDVGTTRIQEFAHALGWSNPRLCEYSGQLYCSSCHTNDLAILPARVLHFWDFSQYPVSQLAKSFLDSIYDQPMLCVSAVNPMLFSKVPALLHVTNIRKKLEKMLPFVRCPFRSSIYKGVGSRRYLLEGSDFFALRDLIDLSKGVFAALPVMVDTILRKIGEHITDHCLICYDVGIPCTARLDCDDPSSLIFPFQEEEIERCKSCDSVFHKHCFKKISICPCGTRLKPEQLLNATKSGQNISSLGNLSWDLLGKKSDLSKGIFSGLLGKVRSLKSIKSEEEGHEDDNTVILMDSLPMTTL